MTVDLFYESSKYFENPIEQFQFFDKYSRFNWDLGRRETWIETVDRTVNFLKELSNNLLDKEDYNEIREAILNKEVMPSMRLLASAGPAARRNNIAIYNCSYLGIDDIKAFGEMMLISMNGCGVGYSVESQYVNKLPLLPDNLIQSVDEFIIKDSTEGWQQATDYLFESLFNGVIPVFDYSQLRPEGAILKTKGGRSSGPAILMTTFDSIIKLFLKYYIKTQQGYMLNASYNRLSTLDAHDIATLIGECSISGGSRRTAMIALFDETDRAMLNAKAGDFPVNRYNANNSVVFDRDVNQVDFLNMMMNMFSNNNGEPGIMNRFAAKGQIPDRREIRDFGLNPCGEIFLRHLQFCNLSAVVARAKDTLDDLMRKIRLATIIGTIQSMATHFPGLREEWVKNSIEERLLGVDITGQRDSELLNNDSGAIREVLKFYAVDVNKKYAEKLGIKQSAAVTCVKPSGNTSVMVNCASGLHARPFKHYLRNVIVMKSTPMYKTLLENSVPMTSISETKALVHFPIKSPDNAITEEDLSAIDQLEYWKLNKVHYTEHNPSCTIKYREDEIVDILDWTWKHKDIISGITFLPIVDADYPYLPIERISEEEYNKLISEFPNIDFSVMQQFEQEDYTTAAQELACSAGVCDLPFLPEELSMEIEYENMDTVNILQ